jgi:pyruvate dehydrogenase E1 component beta subunit
MIYLQIFNEYMNKTHNLPDLMTYREALAISMHDAMHSSPNTVIIGQGVTDFKGIFGTTSGLYQEFPRRVVETPLAEDSVAGICIGMALNGMYPINTHIRADFGLLIFNQLINLAAKYKYMFGGLFDIPMMVRLVVGRSWGQGAQHSQSLQSLLAHIPGLVVLMPSTPQAIIHSYRHAIYNYRGPVVVLEHRLMYELSFNTIDTSPLIDPFGSRLERIGTDITVVATSVMVLEVRRAADYLEQFGINVEIIDLNCISHPDKKMIIDSVRKTTKILVVDTSWVAYGVAAEIARIIAEEDPSILSRPLKSLGMAPAPCPTAKALEDLYYPDVHDISKAIVDLVDAQNATTVPLPKKESMTDFYKHFKGPF